MDWTNEDNWHEAAKLLPLDSAEKLAALAEDIKQNGLQVPIVLLDGKVLDGRNRLLACRAAGVEPRFENWQPNGSSPIDYVISLNLKRRHLSRDQQAATAAELVEILGDDARKRQIEAGKRGAEGGRGRKKPLAENSAEGLGKSSALAAARFPEVTTSAVERILALERNTPGTRDRIKRGEVTIREAAKQQEPKRNKLSDLFGRFQFTRNSVRTTNGTAQGSIFLITHGCKLPSAQSRPVANCKRQLGP